MVTPAMKGAKQRRRRRGSCLKAAVSITRAILQEGIVLDPTQFLLARFAESETSRHISALTAIGEDEDDDDDEDDEEAEEDFFDTSIETLTARTTTRLRAASDRHVALKAERDDLTERKTLVEEELRAVEAESEGVSKELEKLRERADRASRRAKKDSIRRPKLEEVANLAAKEAAELLAARDDAEKERNVQLAAKARAESDLKLLRIRVTTAEQEITERKLQLVNAQDEAVGLRVQAKAAEEMSGRRIEIDLPAAQVAHNDLREERDTLKSRVEFEQRATIDAASDVEALERILFSTRGEVETQRVQSVYAVDELSAADEATRNATAQCDRHEAAAAFALAHQALESRDAIHIEENLAKRQLATTEQVHALERNAEELAIVLEVVRARAREKCLTAALAVDRACAVAQDRLGAEAAAFDAAKASIQIQSERAAHESTRLDVEWQEKQVLTESLETTIDREHRCAERLRGRVGSELVCQHDSLEGPQSKLDDARSEAAHMSTLSNHASVLLAAAADRLSAAEADADRCADAADAAYCADLAIIRHCDLTRDELVASSSGGAAVKELAMQTNCHETTLRDSLATLELRVFAAEEDATHASSATTQVEMELTETRAKHNFQCGSYSGMGERAPLENPLVSSAKELAQDREEGLAAVTKQLLDAQRACKLASVKVARLNVERDRDAALRAMSNAERTRFQRAMDALAMEQQTTLLASDAIATVQLAAEDSQARLDLQSEQGRDLDGIQVMLYDEQLAAEAACAAQGYLVDSLDQCVAPETAATASTVGQLGHAMRITADISGALRDARRQEAKTRIERDEAVACVSNKASRSAATSVKVRDVIARRALLNAELDVMRDSLTIAQVKLGARDRRDCENQWVKHLWQQAAQLFEGENGLCNIDQILPDSDLKDEARNHHVLDDRRSAASIENYDSEYQREIPNIGAIHPLSEALSGVVRDAARNLRSELNNEENRRRKLAIEVETLKQEALRRRPLRTVLRRFEANRNKALAELDLAVRHASVAESSVVALREEVSSCAENATSALSKTAVALGSAEVLRASLLVAHGQVERAAAEAERMRAASLVTEDDAAQASTTLDQRRVLATHVASNRARGAVVRSSIETARMIVGKAAVGANAERDDLAHRAKQELEVRDVAGAVNETQSYLLESGRRERRDSLAKHVADLQKLHMLHVRADEETTTIRKAVTAAARSARCHDTRLRDRLLLSACTSDSIVATASTHLRHDTNAAQIKAKHALESRKRLTEAIQQKKSTVETIVHLHAKVSADVDITRAKLVSLRDELAIYQKLAIYQSKHHKICTAGVSKHRPTVGDSTANIGNASSWVELATEDWDRAFIYNNSR